MVEYRPAESMCVPHWDLIIRYADWRFRPMRDSQGVDERRGRAQPNEGEVNDPPQVETRRVLP